MREQVGQAASINVSKLSAAMRTSYCIPREQIPNSKFGTLIELQQLNGCSELKGETYSHHSIVSEMQECAASVIQREKLSDIDRSPFVGVMIDETVNVTVNKKLILFVRYVKNGEPCTTFIGNYTILAGDAETVFTKLTDVLREKGIDCVKVVGLGSDGASVMTGPITGVGKRLSAISPHLVHVHCVAHRVALVASNAARH